MLEAIETFLDSKLFGYILAVGFCLSVCHLVYLAGRYFGLKEGMGYGSALAAEKVKVVEKETVLFQYFVPGSDSSIIYDPRTPGILVGVNTVEGKLHIYKYDTGEFEHQQQDVPELRQESRP